jgi:hypothetical protein
MKDLNKELKNTGLMMQEKNCTRAARKFTYQNLPTSSEEGAIVEG